MAYFQASSKVRFSVSFSTFVRSRRHGSPRNFARILTIALVVVTSSCASAIDVREVKKYAASVANAGVAFDAMSSDLYSTCRMTREFVGATRLAGDGATASDPLSSRPLQPPFPQRPMDPPLDSTESTASKPPPAATAAKFDPTSDDRRCAASMALAERWKLENDGVLAYVKSLGDLAGVDTAPDAKSFENLGDGLKREGVFSSDGVAKAAGDFVAGIGRVMIRRRQERSLAEVIALANKDDAYVMLLRQVRRYGAAEYFNLLQNEKSIVDSYFEDALSQELVEIKSLRSKNNLVPDPIVAYFGDAPVAPHTMDFVKPKAAFCDDGCKSRNARIAELRFVVDAQRSRWDAIDADILRRASTVGPYYRTIYDLEQAQRALKSSSTSGLAGLISAVRPYVDDLSAQTTALIAALKTPTDKKSRGD